MTRQSTLLHSFAIAGAALILSGVFAAAASAGRITTTPAPVASGTGMGFVNIAAIVTPSQNNDDVNVGAANDNNIVVPLKRFDSTGYIDIVFTVPSTDGVTEYLVTEFVDNNTGVNWSSYTMQLGFGTGAGFAQVGANDGLDFDIGPPGGNNAPPSSGSLPTVNRPNNDTIVYSGGTHGTGAQVYQFRIDVPDISGTTSNTFTLRQQPTAIPEPTSIALIGLALAGLALNSRRR